MKQLDTVDLATFLNVIDRSPQTTITHHLVSNRLATVYIVGESNHFDAALVQENRFPEEPTVFGGDAQATWEILSEIDGWEVVNVPSTLSAELGHIMANAMKMPMRHYGDWYYQLDDEMPTYAPPIDVTIRLLSIQDIALMEGAGEGLQSYSFGSIRRSLEEGIIAGAIVDDELVAMADSHCAPNHINVGVFTAPNWRNRGLSTATASLVIAEGQQRGLRPVWSCGEDNLASIRVAEKLGYHKVSERTYIIPVRQTS